MLQDLEFELYLIRHGESEGNVKPFKMGQAPATPLTKLGEDQARKLGSYCYTHQLFFDKIYSSPYDRALNTARISQFHAPPIILAPELREYSAGDWTGLSREDTISPEIRQRMDNLHQAFLPPNGESLNQVERRASKWLEDTILYNEEMQKTCQNHLQNTGKPYQIACYSHGMTIKTICHFIMGFDQSFTYRVNIGNTSITKFHFKNGWRLDYLNSQAHLESHERT